MAAPPNQASRVASDAASLDGGESRLDAVAATEMRPSGRVRGKWWLRSKNPRPVVQGIDFILDTQCGGGDEVEFIPDTDTYEEGFSDDELVAQSDAQHAVDGFHTSTSGVTQVHRQ